MREPKRKSLRKMEELAGVCCFIAGLLAPVLGMVFLGFEWMTGIVGLPWLHITGTVLLVLGIPLILFAGFCLDWAEAGQKVNNPGKSQPRGSKFIQTSPHFSC